MRSSTRPTDSGQRIHTASGFSRSPSCAARSSAAAMEFSTDSSHADSNVALSEELAAFDEGRRQYARDGNLVPARNLVGFSQPSCPFVQNRDRLRVPRGHVVGLLKMPRCRSVPMASGAKSIQNSKPVVKAVTRLFNTPRFRNRAGCRLASRVRGCLFCSNFAGLIDLREHLAARRRVAFTGASGAFPNLALEFLCVRHGSAPLLQVDVRMPSCRPVHPYRSLEMRMPTRGVGDPFAPAEVRRQRTIGVGRESSANAEDTPSPLNTPPRRPRLSVCVIEVQR